ncbi:MAG: glycosyltransferase, partial [Deltaproteobacteria bacterium]|nr:glycosyltransferase [Deltaproteobacteria bacterium]
MTPRLSVVVVVHDMPDQAERTLRSLSPELQRDAPFDEYEIVVVENDSPRLLGEARAKGAAPNVRYLHRADGTRSPVQA